MHTFLCTGWFCPTPDSHRFWWRRCLAHPVCLSHQVVSTVATVCYLIQILSSSSCVNYTIIRIQKGTTVWNVKILAGYWVRTAICAQIPSFDIARLNQHKIMPWKNKCIHITVFTDFFITYLGIWAFFYKKYENKIVQFSFWLFCCETEIWQTTWPIKLWYWINVILIWQNCLKNSLCTVSLKRFHVNIAKLHADTEKYCALATWKT